MKRRLTLLLLLLALGAVAYWLWRRDTGTTLSGPLSDFAVQDTSAVTRIFIAETGGKTVDLRRTVGVNGSDTWTVNGLPANPYPVRLLLKTFLRVEVRSPVAKAAEANVLRRMSTVGKKVEIYMGGEKPEKIWFVGYATADHFGTYMLLERPDEGRSSVPFIMGMSGFTGFLSTRFHANLDDWRSTDVFVHPDLSQVASVRVAHPSAPGTGFSIDRADGGLRLRDGGGRELPMDTAAVQDMLLQFKGLHFENFERSISTALRDSILQSTPFHEVAVKTIDGTDRMVRFWRKPPYKEQKDVNFNLITEDLDRMYALLDDTALVVVQRHLFDRITPPVDALAGP